MDEMRPTIIVPYEILSEAQDWKSEAQDWKNGKVYRVKMVLRQIGSSEDSSSFELLDASSMNQENKEKNHDYFTDTGYVKSNS